MAFVAAYSWAATGYAPQELYTLTVPTSGVRSIVGRGPVPMARYPFVPNPMRPQATTAPSEAAPQEPEAEERDVKTLMVVRLTAFTLLCNAAQRWIIELLSIAHLPYVLLGMCLLPPCLGFWKSEYTVSYGYGTATALSALAIYTSAAHFGCAPLALAHCILIILYGVRLNLYLLYRETCIPKFRLFRERIEERATQRGPRLARAPFVVSCGFLYMGLVAPLMLSASWASLSAGHPMTIIFQALIGLAYLGFAIASFGDLQKSYAKSKNPGLVTGGIYSWLRHPNYTGEQLMWTASFLAGALAYFSAQAFTLAQGAYLLVSLLGCVGINFVLAQATAQLEKRQAEKYGNDDEYKSWIGSSWAGFGVSQ
uniref:Steroid 5-alpha reductase C-terminal domain-containing protein n=1 Tax=Eutreptiella gymnastica TaxID=73025 RepID=A0A7S1I9S9_9EUGL